MEFDAGPESVSSRWDRFVDWQLVLPPNRPGSEVLRTIRSALAQQPLPRRAAVLGSTSEYIDLLVNSGITDITCFDRSLEFNALSKMFRQHPEAEQLVVGDWLETLPTAREKFDLILSDFTLGNIAYKDQGKFLAYVAGSLCSTGIFIDRVLTFRQPCHSYESLVARFSLEPSNLVTLNSFNSMWLFCGQRVENDQIVDCSSTYQWTLNQFDQPYIRWLAENCSKISPDGGIWYYGKPWREIAQVYGRDLEIIAEYPEPVNSSYYGRAFVIVSRPRRLSRLAPS